MGQRDRPEHLRSRVFARMFFSYVAIIVAFVAFYCAWYLRVYASHNEDLARGEVQQRVEAMGTRIDRQLLGAQGLCAAVNASSACRALQQTLYTEKKAVDTMQLYRVLSELKRIKASSNSLAVYNLLLCFQGDNKAYTASSVVDYEGENALLGTSPYLGVTTVKALLGVQKSTNILMNKEFFVYAEDYALASTGAAKGVVLVLLERGGLASMMREAAQDMAGASLSVGGAELLSVGEREGVAFTANSMVVPGLVYEATLPERALRAPLLTGALVPLAGSALLGLAFIAASYLLARRYYQPIGNIGQMLGTTGENEIENMLSGIRELIGERNGYREKMVTISPYARQGMLHSLISGDERHTPQLDVLIDEHFLSLRRACYMLALVDVADMAGGDDAPEQLRQAQERVKAVCREASGERVTVVCYQRTPRSLYVIASSDDEALLEPTFYTLYERIAEAVDDRRFSVTLGVSRCEHDLDRLRDACADAQAALGQMLVGGRSSVYFLDGLLSQDARRYAFPKDAYKRILQYLDAGDMDALGALLDEIYRRNVVEQELPLDEVRAMVDELHQTLCAALRAFGGGTHIRIERISEAATIDEIFAYYRAALEAAIAQARTMKEEDGAGALAPRILAAIEEGLFDPQLSLSALADRFGVSTKVVSEICKQAYGRTFLQYVHERQIAHAAELFKTTDLSLEEIAGRCGFTNLLTFRRNFKAGTGQNPSEYRR